MQKHAELKRSLYADFSVFQHYNVDRFLASFGLSVIQKYGQRGIGRKLMEARYELTNLAVQFIYLLCCIFDRKLIGLAHRLKITHSSFSSVYSNKLADAVGFELNREYR